MQWTKFHRSHNKQHPAKFQFYILYGYDTTKANVALNQIGTDIPTVTFKDEIARKEFDVIEKRFYKQ